MDDIYSDIIYRPAWGWNITIEIGFTASKVAQTKERNSKVFVYITNLVANEWKIPRKV